MLKVVVQFQIICVYTLWVAKKQDRQTLSSAAAYFI